MSQQYAGASTADTEDVVGLILADHREFERLFRLLRNREEDRAALRGQLADLLVAHAEAEEQEVYPALRRKAPEEAEEIEHGSEEHSEGHEALLELLEVADVDDHDTFEDKLEELVEALNHHIDEEERDILNAARENVGDDERAELGRAFLAVRNRLLEGTPGDVDNVGRLVDEAREKGEL
ncbi:hemerythrin domain-containing protein [Egicoccus halophilus]|uniref:hemerythrin domain-containing protein n=1 Tax=Egicoccus halophilus TaxID=1670830 RepID=UPI00197ADA37|nr:hemerythrin domain-containing protein [Egicoccus halophilus]